MLSQIKAIEGSEGKEADALTAEENIMLFLSTYAEELSDLI